MGIRRLSWLRALAGAEYPGDEADVMTSTVSNLRSDATDKSAAISKLNHALRLADAGYKIFPCWPQGKHARIKRWKHLATSDPEIIRRWWERWPDSDIGILCGESAGVIVIDADGVEGLASLAALEDELGPLPHTRRAITPRGGIHLHFLLPPGVKIKNSVSKVASKIDIRAGHSGKCGLAVGVGSTNSKGIEYCWAEGCGLDTPLASLPAAWVELLKEKPKPNTVTQKTDRIDDSNDHRLKRCEAYLSRLPKSISGNRGHDAILRAACECVRFDLPDSDAMSLLRNFPAEPAWNEDDLSRKLSEARILVSGSDVGSRLREDRLIRRAKGNGHPSHNGNGHAARTDSILVPGVHFVGGREIERGNDDFTNDVLDALPRGILYRRAIPGQILGKSGERYFEPSIEDEMRIIVDGSMRLGVASTDDDGNTEVNFRTCSKDLAGLTLARAKADARVPRLDRICAFPVYLPGFILARPGFNDGTYYDEPAELRGIKPETDADVIREALANLVVDFPFATDADRQNFFGLMMTPIVRPALEGNTPGHLVNAPLERSGKTILVEVVFGGTLTGRKAPAMQISDDNAEMDKRIVAMLLRGQPILHLDNLHTFLDLPCVASLLTASSYQGRLLGKSTMLELPNEMTLCFTGNNVTASGELAKRLVPIVLQPNTDAPELRTDFVHADLWGFVRQQRKLMVSCLLGMVQSWIEAGKPKGQKPLGGFDQWASVVGGIMQLFGYTHWMDNAIAWREKANTKRADLRALVKQWAADHGNLPMTAAEILNIALRIQVFPEVTSAREGKSLVTAFAMRVLGRNVDTPVCDWIIRRDTTSAPTHYHLEPLRGEVKA
jgi:hypothetical protein